MTIPDSAICIFRDGETVIAVRHDFVSPDESPMGRGPSIYAALNDLWWQLRLEGSDAAPDTT